MPDVPLSGPGCAPEPVIRGELDPGIRDAVIYLREHGVNTTESCQGGRDHAYWRPTVHFEGGDHEGLKAVWLLEQAGWQVSELYRRWSFTSGWFVSWHLELESCLTRDLWPARQSAREGDGIA